MLSVLCWRTMCLFASHVLRLMPLDYIFFICVFVMCFVYFVLYSLVFVVLKLFFPILRELSLPEVSQFIISEFTTITPWGRWKYNKNASDSFTN